MIIYDIIEEEKNKLISNNYNTISNVYQKSYDRRKNNIEKAIKVNRNIFLSKKNNQEKNKKDDDNFKKGHLKILTG